MCRRGRGTHPNEMDLRVSRARINVRAQDGSGADLIINATETGSLALPHYGRLSLEDKDFAHGLVTGLTDGMHYNVSVVLVYHDGTADLPEANATTMLEGMVVVGVNTDGDHLADSVDPDDDGDGVANANDTGQAENGTPCRLLADCDGDGVADGADDAPRDATVQTDADGDGVDDSEDQRPMNSLVAYDYDNDDVDDRYDNCIFAFARMELNLPAAHRGTARTYARAHNPGQANEDGDKMGDQCDDAPRRGDTIITVTSLPYRGEMNETRANVTLSWTTPQTIYLPHSSEVPAALDLDQGSIEVLVYEGESSQPQQDFPVVPLESNRTRDGKNRWEVRELQGGTRYRFEVKGSYTYALIGNGAEQTATVLLGERSEEIPAIPLSAVRNMAVHSGYENMRIEWEAPVGAVATITNILVELRDQSGDKVYEKSLPASATIGIPLTHEIAAANLTRARLYDVTVSVNATFHPSLISTTLARAGGFYPAVETDSRFAVNDTVEVFYGLDSFNLRWEAPPGYSALAADFARTTGFALINYRVAACPSNAPEDSCVSQQVEEGTETSFGANQVSRGVLYDIEVIATYTAARAARRNITTPGLVYPAAVGVSNVVASSGPNIKVSWTEPPPVNKTLQPYYGRIPGYTMLLCSADVTPSSSRDDRCGSPSPAGPREDAPTNWTIEAATFTISTQPASYALFVVVRYNNTDESISERANVTSNYPALIFYPASPPSVSAASVNITGNNVVVRWQLPMVDKVYRENGYDVANFNVMACADTETCVRREGISKDTTEISFPLREFISGGNYNITVTAIYTDEKQMPVELDPIEIPFIPYEVINVVFTSGADSARLSWMAPRNSQPTSYEVTATPVVVGSGPSFTQDVGSALAIDFTEANLGRGIPYAAAVVAVYVRDKERTSRSDSVMAVQRGGLYWPAPLREVSTSLDYQRDEITVEWIPRGGDEYDFCGFSGCRCEWFCSGGV